MDIAIAFQPDGTVHIKNNNFFCSRMLPETGRKLTEKDCYYVIDHPYEMLCARGMISRPRFPLARMDQVNVIYNGKKYTIKKGELPEEFIPEGPDFTEHVCSNGDIEVKIFNYFTKKEYAGLKRGGFGKRLIISIDNINELIALDADEPYASWRQANVRIRYKGELLPCQFRGGGYVALEVDGRGNYFDNDDGHDVLKEYEETHEDVSMCGSVDKWESGVQRYVV